jgi:hypothetical protein
MITVPVVPRAGYTHGARPHVHPRFVSGIGFATFVLCFAVGFAGTILTKRP